MRSSVKLKLIVGLSCSSAALALMVLLWVTKTLEEAVLFGIALGLYLTMFIVSMIRDEPDRD